MKIKSSYRYQMRDYRLALLVFYAVMVALAILNVVALSIGFFADPEHMALAYNGADISAAIFAIIQAVVVFGITFGMHLQNGISRKTFLIGKGICIVEGAVVLTLANLAIAAAVELSLWIITGQNMFASSMFEMIHKEVMETLPRVAVYCWNGIFMFLSYLACGALGYLIGVVFYRISLLWKLVIGIGVPCIFVLVLPIIDVLITGGNIFYYIFQGIRFAFGTSSGPFWAGYLTLAAATAVLGIIGWLVTRRATVKE